MGLAGRKQKQRIPADPRNLSWADDASRFGLSYLSKFGWDASQGLGSSGDGMKSHIKVQQKLDTMGIGAQHQRDPNGIAWKQNKEFEALLRRLNESAGFKKGADGEHDQGEGKSVRDMAVSETFVRAQEETVEGESTNESPVTITKRKHDDDPDASKNAKKKKKRDKKGERSPDDAIHATSEPSSGVALSTITKSCPMAHRTRIRAAKRIAGKSAAAIAEVLGITPSTSVSISTTPSPTPPPLPIPVSQPCISSDNLTISTKSVADYFKEKLTARHSSSSSPAESSLSSGSATPHISTTGPGPELSSPDNYIEPPRRGISSLALVVPLASQMSDAGAGSPGGRDRNVDGRDAMTERQRRKAGRKAEKRKRQEAEASTVTTGDVSNLVEDNAEEVQRPSKKERKQREARERKEQLSTSILQSNDKDANEPELKRKSKRQRNDER